MGSGKLVMVRCEAKLWLLVWMLYMKKNVVQSSMGSQISFNCDVDI
jgi:hypothetical protein